jgi:hypothetical protein
VVPNKAQPEAPAAAGGHPRLLPKITNWVIAITALVTALVGLWTVLKPVMPTASPELPTRYEKPHGVIELREGTWYETDEQNRLEIPFEEVSRKEGRTVVYDGSRDLYLRWPNGGGTVQWSKSNPMAWADLYVVKPLKAEKDDK